MRRLISLLSFGCSTLVFAQSAPVGIPSRVVVTIGHHLTVDRVAPSKENFTVQDQSGPRPITKLTPLVGPMEMYLLIDDSVNYEIGRRLDELEKFVRAQPISTSIGVAYVHDGMLRVTEPPTTNRDQVAKALRPPAGGDSATPFAALAELINNWTPGSDRRAVLMISNGISKAPLENQEDPAAEAAITAAQRAGVIVYALYHPSADYLTNDMGILAGQTQLANVAMQTGGQAYFIGFGPLRSLTPFLSDVSDQLTSQYWLEYLAGPNSDCGGLEKLKVRCNIPDLELIVPSRVRVGGSAGVCELQSI